MLLFFFINKHLVTERQFTTNILLTGLACPAPNLHIPRTPSYTALITLLQKIHVQNTHNASGCGGIRPPDPLLGLYLWTSLGDFSPPVSLNVSPALLFFCNSSPAHKHSFIFRSGI